VTATRRASWLVAAAVVLAGAAACGSARRSAPIMQRTFVAPTAEIRRGERVFMAHCHQCHPGGEAGLGPSLNDKPLPGFLIELQTRLGVGAMPGFSTTDIPEPDLDALVAYLEARRRG
jgi:mono/diheme cytochrome c family protein